MATLTTQELFSNSMLAVMSELKGGELKKFCEVKTQSGGESVTFNRLAKSTAVDGVTSMFGANAADGGNMIAYKATIGVISAQDKVSSIDMAKTTIDIKNGYVKSLGNAVNRGEDSKVIAKLAALTAKLAPAETIDPAVIKTECFGATITGYSAKADAVKIIAAIRKAHAYSKLTPDNHRGLALIISAADWAELSTCDYVINADYSAVFGGGTNGMPTTFYGAEVIVVDHDANIGGAKKISYLVPSNTVAFAEWEGSLRGDAEFFATDGLNWHLQASKSVGAVVTEAHVITRFTTDTVA